MNSESISLHFTDGKSDKVYQASLEAKGKGFVVNFAYGRRGATLQTGTKTSSPVAYAKAKAAYDKLVAEKMAKGYTPGTDGTPYQHTSDEVRATGIFPQLLMEIPEADVERLVANADWWMQEKHDGKRIMVCKAGDTVTAINKKGLTCGLPKPIADAISKLDGDLLLDGECVGDVYYVFDLLEMGGSVRDRVYATRYTLLAGVLKEPPKHSGPLNLVMSATSAAQKQALLLYLRTLRAEGVVFKRHDCGMTPGRSATQLKFKFVATASFLVWEKHKTKRSVELALYDAHGHAVTVGNVTVPPNHTVPKPRDVVEVRYLYAYKGGSVYQPVFLGKRDDVQANECLMTQLKYKRDAEGVDSDDDEEQADDPS